MPLLAAVLLAVGCALPAFFVHAHYLKPHGDFYEFREAGRSLWRGELPDTLRRAPLYPLVLHGLGNLCGAVGGLDVPPDQAAAELLNAALLPVNALLLALLVGTRVGVAGVWAGLWLAFLPQGLLLTAHTLVEPFLVTMLLATLMALAHGSRWAFVFASLTLITRYDMAGILPGVLLAALLARRPAAPEPAALRRHPARANHALRTALCGATAALPLAVWLLLTALTWRERSHEHYIAQILSRPVFDPAWSWQIVVHTAMPLDWLRVPIWLSDFEPYLRGLLVQALPMLAFLGAAWWLWRRDPAGIAAICAFTGYWLVHAVFPFHEERFGFPPAPLLLFAASAGAELLCRAFAHVKLGSPVRAAALLPVCVLLAVIGFCEFQAAQLRSAKQDALHALPAAALGAALCVAVALAVGRRRDVVGTIAIGLLALPPAAALSLVQVRITLPLLGNGREMNGLVEAARWVRDNVPAGERVVSNAPGLLRMYAGDEPRGRFLHYEDIAAGDAAGVLAECRERGVTHLIWHDKLYDEHGVFYTDRWRLERFEALLRPHGAPGSNETVFVGPTNIWVIRLTELK